MHDSRCEGSSALATSESDVKSSHWGATKPSINGHDSGCKIIDIRRGGIGPSLRKEILDKLRPGPGREKQMPTLLLYNEAGLKIFEEITYLEEYYLTNAEIQVLSAYADAIAERIPSGSILVELGSGNLRKVKLLLDALERIGRDVEYYALDLSLPELKRTLAEVPAESYTHVNCFGLHGTYDNGLAWIQSSEQSSKTKCILSLGSSIGNFSRADAAGFLKGFGRTLKSGDCMIIGLDACKDKDKVYHAYNDQHGLTHKFIMNGLSHANAILGKYAFRDDDWSVIGEFDEKTGRHQAFYVPNRDLIVEEVEFKAGEKVRVEESYKYSAHERSDLWSKAKLALDSEWSNDAGDYHLHMLSKAPFIFPLDPVEYASKPVPELQAWNELWKAWDAVTRKMILKEDLLSKPIRLRNACIFYLGHIPTFLDMHLARATNGCLTTPAYYPSIFERGIDPDVENPEHCHSHSKIPETWPPVEEIIHVQDLVRDRLRHEYVSGTPAKNNRLCRALWLGFEHEIMHLETLLYMLLQSDKVLPPPGRIRPDFAAMARQADIEAVPNEWIVVPSLAITVGLDDIEEELKPERYYGWDNEKPSRQITVRSFMAKARPITNGEYAYYLERTHTPSIPASWTQKTMSNGVSLTNGHGGHIERSALFDESKSVRPEFLIGKFAKTFYGSVPLAQALHWPVMASYDELAACAKWMNGRIPTYEEVQSIYRHVDQMASKETTKVLARTISAVNGHLLNNGVEESPPSAPCDKAFPSAEQALTPHELFANLEGCNVGFTHWHPVPVTQKGNKLCGRGNLGGVWEWTSSVLEKHDGFEPMDLYPAYTADFFDGKHNIVQGGSWATHPRIAGRRTFVNWYQRNYPYAWIGARLVRDL